MGRDFDALIVGAGLFGATVAHELVRSGRRVLVLERRGTIGGNCATEERDGIHVHLWGPHVFHTNNERVWRWFGQFAEMLPFKFQAVAEFRGTRYPWPPNLETLELLAHDMGYGGGTVFTPELAQLWFDLETEQNHDATTIKGFVMSRYGRRFYETFIEGYSTKQWGADPSTLPASIVRRVPMRLDRTRDFFADRFQGIPRGGYTAAITKMLEGAKVELGVDYLQARQAFDRRARIVLFTGPIDAFFGQLHGALSYRSLTFEHERLDVAWHQSHAVVNYTEARVPYTRVVEHKHFEPVDSTVTWITREFPAPVAEGNDPFYPVRGEHDLARLRLYERITRQLGRRYYFGGRLGSYRYYDMHQAIGAGLKLAKQIDKDLGS
jgi:UDP-galactopyranose mutase